MDSGQAADLAIFLVCMAALLGYGIFYLSVQSFRLPLSRRRYVNLYALNRHSRSDWVLLMARDPKEGINAVQTVRNQVLAVSILAAASSPLAATFIRVLVDSAMVEQIRQYANIDPLTDQLLISPPVRIAIALGDLLLAVMAFAQSLRLSVHVGYVIRVVASDPTRHAALARQMVCIMRRSSLYFAIGLRLFFAFGPICLYILGPTALLIATVLSILAQIMFDIVPAEFAGLESDHDDEKEAASGAVLAAGCNS